MSVVCDYCEVAPATYVIEEETIVTFGTQAIAAAYAPLFYVCGECCPVIWTERATLHWWRRYLDKPTKLRISHRSVVC